MSGTLIFNNLSASNYGLRIGGVNSYTAVGREVQTFRVPGRIGEVIPAKDYVQIPNEIREYNAALYMRAAAPTLIEGRMANIRRWLLGPSGYAELSDSYEPGLYRRAYFIGDVVPVRKGAGQNFEIPLRFSCDPRRFISGDHHFRVAGSGGTATYTTPERVGDFKVTEAAKPLIWISNGGDYAVVTFTDVTEEGGSPRNTQIGQLKIAGETADFWFDCETLTAHYDDGTPANAMIEDVIGEIRLGPGPTKIEFTTSLVALTFYPRWWIR